MTADREAPPPEVVDARGSGPIDLNPLIRHIERTVSSHCLGSVGTYRRWLWQNAAGDRDLGINAYGCADAANILHTIGRFPGDAGERAGWIEILQGLQNPETGFFAEATHHPIHCTAHCAAALELFDARPRFPLQGLSHLRDRSALIDFLESLDWVNRPWPESHRGAGLYAAMVLNGEVGPEWQEWYFSWLWNEADPETGLWRKGCIGEGDADQLFVHLAGSFHYLFNQEYARRPLRYPDRLVDSALRILREDKTHLQRGAEFADIDLVYCLNRSLRQSGHRPQECRDALEDYARRYCAMLSRIEFERDEAWNDLHKLLGATCALAELQSAVPGLLITDRPLRLVLDRRPFI